MPNSSRHLGQPALLSANTSTAAIDATIIMTKIASIMMPPPYEIIPINCSILLSVDLTSLLPVFA